MRHRELPAKEFDNSRSTLSAPTQLSSSSSRV